jgi:hypothetical protein
MFSFFSSPSREGGKKGAWVIAFFLGRGRAFSSRKNLPPSFHREGEKQIFLGPPPWSKGNQVNIPEPDLKREEGRRGFGLFFRFLFCV